MAQILSLGKLRRQTEMSVFNGSQQLKNNLISDDSYNDALRNFCHAWMSLQELLSQKLNRMDGKTVSVPIATCDTTRDTSFVISSYVTEDEVPADCIAAVSHMILKDVLSCVELSSDDVLSTGIFRRLQKDILDEINVQQTAVMCSSSNSLQRDGSCGSDGKFYLDIDDSRHSKVSLDNISILNEPTRDLMISLDTISLLNEPKRVNSAVKVRKHSLPSALESILVLGLQKPYHLPSGDIMCCTPASIEVII